VIVQDQSSDVGAFIAVFAALLLDNVVTLEETVSRVSDLVMGSGRPDRELIVTLQSFDRLKQEFEALGEALIRYAEAATSAAGREDHAQLGRDVIAAISVADLKNRLLSRLDVALPLVSAHSMADVPIDEVDVDVVF
jgi:hypothetical protein